jgi:magnesium chelatase family protein
MFARVSSMGFYGMEAFMVEVEADISQGLPRFDIVGLPDVSVAESKTEYARLSKTAPSISPQPYYR